MTIVCAVLVALGAAVFVFLRQPRFGRAPSGARLERIKDSPHFVRSQCRNIVAKPDLAEGEHLPGIYWKFLFSRRVRPRPVQPVPSCKTDLCALSPDRDILVWFGHSSYFIQVDGKRLLVDPVFGPSASPVSFITTAFAGTNRYTADDIPPLDYVFITHDHWDHLDYETMLALRGKIRTVVCPLGVGEHLERWGCDPACLVETEWGDAHTLDSGFTVHTMTTHHFSGRTLCRNTTMWASYVLKTPTSTLYFGGDGGYGPHFAAIGEQFGPFDLAILENGQYHTSWKYNHMQPEDVLRAADDLHTRALFPAHSAKFVISHHPWDEPLRRITALHRECGPRLVTPMIGEAVRIHDSTQVFTRWWEGVD